MDAAKPGQVQFMQLYVNKDREITKRIVQHAERRGIKGLFITVDAPQLGRREKDMRTKFEDEASDVLKKSEDQLDRSQGAAKAITVGLSVHPGAGLFLVDVYHLVIHRPWAIVERHPVVQEHYKE